MSRALAPLTLDQAAEALGITVDDAANPARHVRELIRRHGIPFTRCGRTVKLRADQLAALAERMDHSDVKAEVPIQAKTYIYFIRYDQFVKIGISTEPHRRMEALQTGNTTKLELLLCFLGDKQSEAELHHRFRTYREKGEWFRIDGDLADFLIGAGVK
jgi:excisionase family DNA binding protein